MSLLLQSRKWCDTVSWLALELGISMLTDASGVHPVLVNRLLSSAIVATDAGVTHGRLKRRRVVRQSLCAVCETSWPVAAQTQAPPPLLT